MIPARAHARARGQVMRAEAASAMKTLMKQDGQ